jgi:hypothetical protein
VEKKIPELLYRPTFYYANWDRSVSSEYLLNLISARITPLLLVADRLPPAAMHAVRCASGGKMVWEPHHQFRPTDKRGWWCAGSAAEQHQPAGRFLRLTDSQSPLILRGSGTSSFPMIRFSWRRRPVMPAGNPASPFAHRSHRMSPAIIFLNHCPVCLLCAMIDHSSFQAGPHF